MVRVAAAVLFSAFVLASPAQAAELSLQGPSPGALVGGAVASAGDFNGDGVEDVVVGGQNTELRGRGQAGSAWVVFGRKGRRDRVIDLARPGTGAIQIRGAGQSAYAGIAVAGGEDFNGDGLDDVVVGTPGHGIFNAGAAAVIFGSRQPRSVDLARELGAHGFRVDTPHSSSGLGVSVALIDDMNGDGRAELGVTNEGPYGAAVVFGRAASGSIATDQLGETGFSIEERFGSTIAAAGDVNGDGRGDVVLGHPQTYNELAYASVIYGKPDAGPAMADDPGRGFRVAFPGRRASLLPTAVGAGDLNSDGFADIALSDPAASPGSRVAAGIVHVVFGGPTGRDVSLDALGDGGFSIWGARGGDGFVRGGDQLGRSIAARDGALFVGSGQGAGAWRVPAGAAPGSVVDLARVGSAAQVVKPAPDERGVAIAAADVDGDGTDEVLVGAWLASPRGRRNAGEITTNAARGAPTRRGDLEPVGEHPGDVYDAGPRFAVARLQDGQLRVFDKRTARTRPIAIPPRCTPGGAGSGYAVVNCENESGAVTSAYVVALAAGSLQRVPVDPNARDLVSYEGIGTTWAVGRQDCYHCEGLLVNWRTGETRQVPSDSDPPECVDLDLAIPVGACPPPGGAVALKAGRYRAAGGGHGSPAQPLRLSGPRGRKVLSRCRQSCMAIDLASGQVRWLERHTAHSVDLRTLRHRRWEIPRFRSSAAHEQYGVRALYLGAETIVSVYDGAGIGPETRTYRLR